MKKINLKTKIFLLALSITLFGGISDIHARTLNFSGYDWEVKETASGTTMGPGANNWGSTVTDDQNDARVDSDGKLHLFVSQRPNGQWYSSEVYLQKSLGYGKYTFDFESPVDKIDSNLVAAPFIYKDDQHELDIEYSYWQIPGSTNLHYTVQPLQSGQYNDTNQLNQTVSLNNNFSRNIIDWTPESVSFSTLDENGTTIGSGWKKYETGDGTVNFQDDSEHAHINFWQINGSTPSNSTTNELIVKAFSFEKYSPSSTVNATPVPATFTVTVSSTSSGTSTTTTSDATNVTSTLITVLNEDPTVINSTTTSSNNSTPLEEIGIHVKIKTFDSSVFDETIGVKSCEETPNSGIFTMNAWCAIKQAAANGNLSLTYNWGDFGVFITSINQYNGADGKWWLWYSDVDGLNPGATALNKHILQNGETILLTYGVSPLRIFLNDDNNENFIYSTTTLTAQYFNDLEWMWKTASDVNFEIKHAEQTINTTSTNGQYNIFLDSNDTYSAKTTKDGFIDSDTMWFEPKLPKTSINLKIWTSQNGLETTDGLSVFACKETNANDAKYTLNAKCALEKSGQTIDWSTWGTDMFLNSINSYQNNQNGNGVYWNWFSGLDNNLDYGQTALNKHILTANENLLLTYDVLPLKISADSYTPSVGSTSTITLEEFGFDASFNPVWKKANSSTLLINKKFELANDNGTYYLPITSTEPIYIFGQKPGFVGMLLTLNPTTTNSGTTTENQTENNSGGSSGGTNQNHNKIDVAKAVEFLSASQNTNGSFGSNELYTDWAAIALATQNDNNTAKSKIKEYLLTDPNFSGGLNPVSDLARRSMALMSLGINPYTGTKTNFIQKIVDSFDGTQFGDNTLYNDDIFALFPLLKAGYKNTDSMIVIDVQFILSKQKTNGSWDGIDLTAAAIQALSQTTNIDGVNTALENAKKYLQTSQGNNGGFGGIESTAWAIQGIHSLNENPDNWLKNNFNPHDFLYTMQSKDGGMDSWSEGQDNLNSRIWSTSYSIPAGLNKSWNEILISFSLPTTTIVANSTQTGGTAAATTLTTTTVATTTTLITTTTVAVTSTSTPTSTIVITTTTVPNSVLAQKNTAPEEKLEKKENTIAPKNIRAEIADIGVTPKKEDAKPQQVLSAGQPQNTQKEIIDDLPLDTPTKRNAKKILAISGGSALAVGGYLGLRLLRNMI